MVNQLLLTFGLLTHIVSKRCLFLKKSIEYKDDIHFLMIDAVDGRRETKEKGQIY